MYMKEAVSNRGDRYVTIEGSKGKFVVLVGSKRVVVGQYDDINTSCDCGCGLPKWRPLDTTPLETLKAHVEGKPMPGCYEYKEDMLVDFDGFVLNIIDTYARKSVSIDRQPEVMRFVELMRQDERRDKYILNERKIKAAAKAVEEAAAKPVADIMTNPSDDDPVTEGWLVLNGFEHSPKEKAVMGKKYMHGAYEMGVVVDLVGIAGAFPGTPSLSLVDVKGSIFSPHCVTLPCKLTVGNVKLAMQLMDGAKPVAS